MPQIPSSVGMIPRAEDILAASTRLQEQRSARAANLDPKALEEFWEAGGGYKLPSPASDCPVIDLDDVRAAVAVVPEKAAQLSETDTDEAVSAGFVTEPGSQLIRASSNPSECDEIPPCRGAPPIRDVGRALATSARIAFPDDDDDIEPFADEDDIASQSSGSEHGGWRDMFGGDPFVGCVVTITAPGAPRPVCWGKDRPVRSRQWSGEWSKDDPARLVPRKCRLLAPLVGAVVAEFDRRGFFISPPYRLADRRLWPVPWCWTLYVRKVDPDCGMHYLVSDGHSEWRGRPFDWWVDLNRLRNKDQVHIQAEMESERYANVFHYLNEMPPLHGKMLEVDFNVDGFDTLMHDSPTRHAVSVLDRDWKYEEEKCALDVLMPLNVEAAHDVDNTFARPCLRPVFLRL
mmetsp:Transcript_60841/g.163251  ORF Transcript_60841/g.163251 Transcript_60841/m.163251 type:complete len:403 (+) Transcript_60841:15-1223(+)